MKYGGVWVGKPKDTDLSALLDRSAAALLTYDHAGSTLLADGGGRPSALRRTVELGSGYGAFAAAVEALKSWVPQRALGATIRPEDAEVKTGATLVVVLPKGPLSMVAPNRVVEVVDELNHFAYAYGTLPGHPERGEESFSVERRPDGTVAVTITLDAAPDSVPARLGGPVSKRLQHWAVGRYLAAIAAHVNGSSEP